jgi:peptide-methionine (S)-S-oxide reductase
MQTFVLAGGCFWCLDAVYRTLRGVTSVVTGSTGHAEAVAVTFDETVIPAEIILNVFFTLHDPRQLNRQGNDIGTQYRSAMYYADEEQKALFAAAIERASEIWDGEIVTQLEPLGEFYEAEQEHQGFFAKNPGQGYCMAVAVPKVNKVRKSFAEYVLAV